MTFTVYKHTRIRSSITMVLLAGIFSLMVKASLPLKLTLKKSDIRNSLRWRRLFFR